MKQTARWGRVGRVLFQLMPFVRPHAGTMALAALFTTLVIGASLLQPWPMKVVIDQLILGRSWHAIPAWVARQGETTRLLLACCAAVLVIAVLNGIFEYAKTILLATVGHRVVADLRAAVHRHLLNLSLKFHGQQRSGDLLVRLSGDAVMMRTLLVEGVFELAEESAMLLGMLAVMAWLDWRLALAAAMVAPVVLLVMVLFGRRLREAARQARRKEGEMGAAIGESLAGVPLIQAYSLVDAVVQRFRRSNKKSMKAGLASARLEGRMSGWTEVALALGVSSTLLLGVQRVHADAMSAGELIVMLTYVRSLYKPLRRIAVGGSRLFKATACGERLLEVLDVPPDLPLPRDPVRLGRVTGEVVFDGVEFAYRADQPVLARIDLRIAPGERVAIVGANGSGKSTLGSLIPRLRDVERGSVRIDGKDVRSLDLTELRRSIAVLFQDTMLFDGTLLDNIQLGHPEARADEVRRAAELAGVVRFADALPDGLDTEVGERGVALSGGQRQRIALARALLRDAPIVLLDEPTSGLDEESQTRFVDELLESLRGRTVILMTHDPRLVAAMDRVLKLEGGRVHELPPPEGAPILSDRFRRRQAP